MENATKISHTQDKIGIDIFLLRLEQDNSFGSFKHTMVVVAAIEQICNNQIHRGFIKAIYG